MISVEKNCLKNLKLDVFLKSNNPPSLVHKILPKTGKLLKSCSMFEEADLVASLLNELVNGLAKFPKILNSHSIFNKNDLLRSRKKANLN